MKKITVDIDILLDFLLKREGHQIASKIIDLCFKKEIIGYVCAHEITTISYFLFKSEKNRRKVIEILNKFINIFQIIPVDKPILINALTSQISDYEDAVIDVSSTLNNIKYIITNNISDFKNSTVNVLTPEQYLFRFSKQQKKKNE